MCNNNKENKSIDDIISNLTKNIDYVQGDLKTLLSEKKEKKEKKEINVLWGIQPRDIPTLEIFIPILKIIDFLQCLQYNFKITILIADVHQMLDTPDLTIDIIKKRGEAYIQLILNLIEIFDINSFNVKFVFGSTFQTNPNYIIDTYKISALSTIQRIYYARELNLDDTDKKINLIPSETTMSTLLYPILQALDEKYTKADIFFGSITQKNMCVFSADLMKKFNQSSKMIYLLQDYTKKINIKFDDSIIKIEEKTNKLTDDDIFYILDRIVFNIMSKKNDTFVIFDKNDINNRIKINNYIELKEIYKNKLIDKTYLVDITANYLYKYLYLLRDLLTSSQMKHYIDCGWNNKKFY